MSSILLTFSDYLKLFLIKQVVTFVFFAKCCSVRSKSSLEGLCSFGSGRDGDSSAYAPMGLDRRSWRADGDGADDGVVSAEVDD